MLLYICCLIFVDCIFILFSYTLKEQLIFRRKSRAIRESCYFFKMQLFIGYSNSFLIWGIVKQGYDQSSWLFQCTTIFMLKLYELKKQKWIIAVFILKYLCTKDTGNSDNNDNNKEFIIYLSPTTYIFFSNKCLKLALPHLQVYVT